jgi:hypothetical protein
MPLEDLSEQLEFLVLAEVAMRIPMFPASAEKIAPMIKAGTIIQCVDSTYIEIPKRAIDAAITNTNNNRYSAFKKARAPFLMLSEICFIRSVPASCLFTQDALMAINKRPITPNNGIK